MGKAGKKKGINPLLEITDAINRKMHRPYTPHMFICKNDLDQIWADHSLRGIFPSFSSEERQNIRENFIRVLSMLIHVGWTDLSRFRPLFLRETGRDDSHLPFEDLAFLGNLGPAISFNQHAFTPVVIEEHNERYIQGISPKLRLPFIEEPELLGKGGYGSVTKRVIAPRCLWNKEDNKDNPEPTPVACKSYKSENPLPEFRKEVGNLDYIKESLTDSKRVMKHIAAIVHGNEFMIISPLAKLRDLEIFLRGGYEPDPGTECLKKIYDFDIEFPMLDTPIKLQHAVVREAHQLASALKWLHEDLKIFGSSDRYLAHMDLKPANILLVGDPRGDPRLPAGKWMLSDFGVSSFDKATNARVPDTPSIHDVGLNLTSRGLQDRVMRGHGPYQPPEVDLDNVDSRKCDVWSFSCVLCDILAFAIGKTEAVSNLRSSRYNAVDDYFYETVAPTRKEIDDMNIKLKKPILEWWVKLEDPPSTTWVSNYIKVLRKALKPKPSDRPGIGAIVQGLSELAPSIDSQANGTHTPESETFEWHEERPLITFSSVSSSLDRQFNHLQDTSLTEPEHSTEHLEDRGQSSPNTKDQNDGATPADTVNEGPDVLERHPPSPPDRPSSERQIVSVSIFAFEERSKISIPMPKKAKIKAVAITPSSRQVAVLCKQSVHLYSTIDGDETNQHVELSAKVDWTKIRLVSQYFAVYGTGLSQEKHIELFDSKSMSPIETVRNDGEVVHDILLSDKNVIAYVYGNSVKLYFVRAKRDSTVPFRKDNALIIRARFCASGRILCVWATGTRADHAYFVRIDEELASFSLCGEGKYQKMITDSRTCDVWPYPDAPACLIHDAHGGTFLAQPMDQDQPPLEPLQRDSIGIPNALIGCVVREDLLVCLESKMLRSGRRLCGLALSRELRGLRRIAGRVQDLSASAANKDIQKSTAVATCLINGKSELVLCTTNGKILRYVQS